MLLEEVNYVHNGSKKSTTGTPSLELIDSDLSYFDRSLPRS